MKKVTLPDGRVVSRQRAHVIKNEHARQLQIEASKRYHEKNKEKELERHRNWQSKYLEENGIPYHVAYYQNVTKLRRENAKKAI